MNAEKLHHSEIRIAINDESQGSVATYLRFGGVVNNHIKCKLDHCLQWNTRA